MILDAYSDRVPFTQVAEQILGRKLPQTRDGFVRLAEEERAARRAAD